MHHEADGGTEALIALNAEHVVALVCYHRLLRLTSFRVAVCLRRRAIVGKELHRIHAVARANRTASEVMARWDDKRITITTTFIAILRGVARLEH